MKTNPKLLSLGVLCLVLSAFSACVSDDGDKASANAEDPGMYADETEGEATPTAGAMLQNQSTECQKWMAKKKKNKKSEKFKAMSAKCKGAAMGKKAGGKGMKGPKGAKGAKVGKGMKGKGGPTGVKKAKKKPAADEIDEIPAE